MKPSVALCNVSKVYSPGKSLASMLGQMIGKPHAWSNGAGTKVARVAVDAVNLRVGLGERLGIIGPNGAGKTTLLHLIAGLAAPTCGRVEVEGRVTAIFTLGQGLREDLTGRENIYVDGEVQGKSRAEIDDVIDEIVAFAELGEFIEYPLHTYSTGMKARLAFAMLIHINPEILLIDEALSAGDGPFSVKAHRKMQELCNRGTIGIIVSHSMSSIRDLCTRCLWLEEGHVVMDGDPAVVTCAYQEAVRRRDETILAERFRRQMAAQSFRQGCHVVGFEARVPAAEPGSRSILLAGENVDLQMAVRVDASLRAPELRLSVMRLDGLVVVENRRSLTSEVRRRDPDEVLRYRVAMRPLVLGTGIYRATVELLDSPDVLAMRSILFEVVARRAPTGGRPALLYPCSVSAKLIG